MSQTAKRGGRGAEAARGRGAGAGRGGGGRGEGGGRGAARGGGAGGPGGGRGEARGGRGGGRGTESARGGGAGAGAGRGGGGGGRGAPPAPAGVPAPDPAAGGRGQRGGRGRGAAAPAPAPWAGEAPATLRVTPEQAKEQEMLAAAEAEREQEQVQEERREAAIVAAQDIAPRQRTERRTPDSEVKNVVSRPATTGRRFGRQTTVTCNHFPFNIRATPIFQYTVEFKPEVESKGARFRLLDQLKDELGVSYIFDGVMLFLTKHVGDIELQARARDDSVVRVILNLTKKLDHPTLQVSNLMFIKILRMLKLKPIGRQHFDPTRPIEVPQHKIQLWPGYFTSISTNQKGIMLIADVAHKVLRTDTVLDFLSEALATKRQAFRPYAMEQLVGTIVITRYNNRTYRIDDIDWNKTPRSKFTKRTGEQISYIDYYRNTYSRDMITELDQPLLLHRHRRRGAEDELIYLIPELCSMTGITDAMRQDFNVMKDLGEHTRVGPGIRKKEVDDFVLNVNKNPEVQQKLLKSDWGLQVDTRTPAVPARILDPERLYFGGNAAIAVDARSAEWMHATSKSRVLGAVPLSKWLFIYTSRSGRQAEDFIRQISAVGREVGLAVAPPVDIRVEDDRPATYLNAARRNITDDMEVVVFLMASPKKDLYDQMKQLFCLELPIPSQGMLQRSLNNPKRILSVVKNILLQINCKQGGELWRLDIPVPKTMVVGIDVYHDTAPGGRRSVAGIIASTNANFTKYYSRVTIQSQQGKEIIDGLGRCMVDALKHYFKVNNFLPERIIIYRDGVGDGMLQLVVPSSLSQRTVCSTMAITMLWGGGVQADHEITQLHDAFAKIGPTYKPRLAVVVVKKRIHTRILANPQPGTVVDSDIVHPTWYDFFLVSQSVKQGTVTPSHYHVIADNTGLTPDQMQVLTYKLCHLYFNWPGTIRVPAPCQYAHKIAFLVGQSLHKNPHISLADRLYFL